MENRIKGTVIKLKEDHTFILTNGLYNAMWERDFLLILDGPNDHPPQMLRTTENINFRQILCVRIIDDVVETFARRNIEDMGARKIHIFNGSSFSLPFSRIRHKCEFTDGKLVFNKRPPRMLETLEYEYSPSSYNVSKDDFDLLDQADIKEIFMWGPRTFHGNPLFLEITTNNDQTFFHELIYIEG